jgi:hypothetical protein
MFESFLAEPTKANLNTLLAIYMVAIVVMLLQQWTSKRAIGLPMAYAFSFSILYAVGAFIYGLPGYTPKSDILVQNNYSLQNTFLGFRMACLGFCSFVVGVLSAAMVLRKDPPPKQFYAAPRITSQLPGTLLIVSLLCFFGAPVLSRIPSFGSMGTAGAYISVIAVYIFCFKSYLARDWWRFLLGLVATAAFPFVTIVFLGFAGYGSGAASMVWMFVLRFYRPRWLSLGVLALVMFAGIIENFEMLSFKKQYHLELIDNRLNQNDLAGKAVRYLAQGKVDYANGYTLWVAAIAWVPRILWPGKPATGGSGGVVSHFTGQKFADGTSVGAGNVLEFYVNFGWYGVVGGFFILGYVITWFDRRGAFYFQLGDYWSATRWLLPGLGLIQPGGLLAEATGSCSAFAVFVLILHHAFFKKFYDVGVRVPQVRGPNLTVPTGQPVKPLPRPRYPE